MSKTLFMFRIEKFLNTQEMRNAKMRVRMVIRLPVAEVKSQGTRVLIMSDLKLA